MKAFILTFCILCSSLYGLAQSTDTLNNNGIIKLVKGKVPHSVILNKIESAPSKFDLTTNGLVYLSKNGVPEDIINAMIAHSNKATERGRGRRGHKDEASKPREKKGPGSLFKRSKHKDSKESKEDSGK